MSLLHAWTPPTCVYSALSRPSISRWAASTLRSKPNSVSTRRRPRPPPCGAPGAGPTAGRRSWPPAALGLVSVPGIPSFRPRPPRRLRRRRCRPPDGHMPWPPAGPSGDTRWWRSARRRPSRRAFGPHRHGHRRNARSPRSPVHCTMFRAGNGTRRRRPPGTSPEVPRRSRCARPAGTSRGPSPAAASPGCPPPGRPDPPPRIR